MRVVIGSDHAGWPLKNAVIEHVRSLGHEVVDVGSFDDKPVDFPDIARALTEKVKSGEAERGIMVCGTGVGASIAANKVAGVRAALCGDAATAEGARRWNDANVLALSIRTTTDALAAEILDAFLSGQPDPGEAPVIATLE